MGWINTAKLKLLIVVIFAVLLLAPLEAFAQQQTGQVAPGTQNPQNNAPRLFNQNNNVQTPGSQSLLNRRTEINIPPGQPAQPEDEAADNSSSRPFIMILLSVVGVIISIILFRKSMKIESKAPPKPIVEETDTKEHVVVKAPVKKKKKSKNKGKPRKRK